MSGKNAYLEKQRKARQVTLDIGEEMGIQKCWDYFQLVLTDPAVMSTHVVTRERLEKIYTALSEIAGRYADCFTSDVEADVLQEELDARLREIWGDKFQPFYERYPYIKKLEYSKPMKGWN